MAKKKEVDNQVETVDNVQQETASADKKSTRKLKKQTDTQLSARTATN